jgi:UDP-N-acetylglucosamine/UDP-N-acetylgalactosamine diphosphorylase
MYSLGPVSWRTLFQMHVDQLRAVSRRYGVPIPLYVMTSPATHEETVAYFTQNDRLGLEPEELHFFCQGTMPAVDDQGRLLLADRGQIFLSPDGHGGMLAAIADSGCLGDAAQRGIDLLFYWQVDNPLARICDRELIGYHLLSESEMSTQVVAKRDPLDKVGNVVSVDGRLRVVEYSDLPPAAGRQRQEDGSLRFWAGSIAIHVFSVSFLERSARADESLPFHRACKKVAFVSEEGLPISPDQPNATKFERFIFDLMPLAKNAIVVEADEQEVFAPLKNARGADRDTPELTRQAIVDRARRWLAAVGVEVVPGTKVEIHPDYALDPQDLVGKLSAGVSIDRDTFFS